MKIIREADGGLYTHKKKMSETLKNISRGPNCQCRSYDDGEWETIPLHEWGRNHDGDGIYGVFCIHDNDFYYNLERQERFKSLWPKEALRWCCRSDLEYWVRRGVEELRNDGFSQDEIIPIHNYVCFCPPL